MEAACRKATYTKLSKASISPHSIVGAVLALAFCTKDPDRVVYSVNVFLFPYLSFSAGLKYSLIVRWRGTVLISGIITSFADTITLKGIHKTAPLKIWYTALNQMEAQAVLCEFFLVYTTINTMAFDMEGLIEKLANIGTLLK